MSYNRISVFTRENKKESKVPKIFNVLDNFYATKQFFEQLYFLR